MRVDEFAQAIAAQLERRGIADTGLTEPRKLTWKQIVAELDRRADAEREAKAKAKQEAEAVKQPKLQGLVDELRAALESHNAGNDTPGLNDSRLLTALQSSDGSKSAKESVAELLYRFRDQPNQ